MSSCYCFLLGAVWDRRRGSEREGGGEVEKDGRILAIVR